MLVSIFGGELSNLSQPQRGDVYSNEEILLQRHKSSGKDVMEVTRARNRATMSLSCLLSFYLSFFTYIVY